MAWDSSGGDGRAYARKHLHKAVGDENGIDEPSSIVINEVQLLLAEKRTSLAAMRTGIAVFALPLSVLSILVATSKYYNVMNVIYFIMPLLILCLALIILGSYLVIRAIIRLHRYDRIILSIKQRHRYMEEFLA